MPQIPGARACGRSPTSSCLSGVARVEEWRDRVFNLLREACRRAAGAGASPSRLPTGIEPRRESKRSSKGVWAIMDERTHFAGSTRLAARRECEAPPGHYPTFELTAAHKGLNRLR